MARISWPAASALGLSAWHSKIERSPSRITRASLTPSAGLLVPAGNAFHALRAIKNDEELAIIAEAARITDAAFTAVTSVLQAGVSEREAAWQLESAMHDFGRTVQGSRSL
jgi:Xaa-Pro aminopeptidase